MDMKREFPINSTARIGLILKVCRELGIGVHTEVPQPLPDSPHALLRKPGSGRRKERLYRQT